MHTNQKNFFYRPLDESKLTELIEKSGMNKTHLEYKLGHSSGFFLGCVKRGTMRTSDIETIKALYGIDLEKHGELKNEPTETQADDEMLDAIKRKIGANNLISKQIKEELEAIKKELSEMKIQNKDIIGTLHTIGNLLAQINEKCFKK